MCVSARCFIVLFFSLVDSAIPPIFLFACDAIPNKIKVSSPATSLLLQPIQQHELFCSYFYCDKNGFWSPVYYTQCNNALPPCRWLTLLSFAILDFCVQAFAPHLANVWRLTVVIYHKNVERWKTSYPRKYSKTIARFGRFHSFDARYVVWPGFAGDSQQTNRMQ